MFETSRRVIKKISKDKHSEISIRRISVITKVSRNNTITSNYFPRDSFSMRRVLANHDASSEYLHTPKFEIKFKTHCEHSKGKYSETPTLIFFKFFRQTSGITKILKNNTTTFNYFPHDNFSIHRVLANHDASFKCLNALNFEVKFQVKFKIWTLLS